MHQLSHTTHTLYNSLFYPPLDLLAFHFSVQILIDAGNKQNNPASGGYAVDDIRFDDCAFDAYSPSEPCPTNSYQCSDQQCYDKDSQCDLSKDCCTDSGNGNDEASCGKYTQCLSGECFIKLVIYDNS